MGVEASSFVICTHTTSAISVWVLWFGVTPVHFICLAVTPHQWGGVAFHQRTRPSHVTGWVWRVVFGRGGVLCSRTPLPPDIINELCQLHCLSPCTQNTDRGDPEKPHDVKKTSSDFTAVLPASLALPCMMVMLPRVLLNALHYLL